MKEQVKGILFDFKDAGWTVQRVEKTLGFSNGSLGKPISEYRFHKLLELHRQEVKKRPTVTEALKEQIEQNNIPENKSKINDDRNGSTMNEIEQMIYEEEQKILNKKQI